MNSQSSSRATLFAKIALGLSTVLLLVAVIPGLAHKAPANVDANASRGPTVKGRVVSGTEVVAFFIASSTCGASLHRNLPSALRKIRADLAARAKDEGKKFIYAGVALDEKPATGIEFLKSFAPFDEVMSGGSWLGTGSVDFMIRGMPGPLMTPQLLIVERDIKVGGSAITVGPDRIVSRSLGFVDIFKLAGLSDSGSVAR